MGFSSVPEINDGHTSTSRSNRSSAVGATKFKCLNICCFCAELPTRLTKDQMWIVDRNVAKTLTICWRKSQNAQIKLLSLLNDVDSAKSKGQLLKAAVQKNKYKNSQIFLLCVLFSRYGFGQQLSKLLLVVVC